MTKYLLCFYLWIHIFLQNDESEKLKNLKRKLKNDREVAYEKRRCLEKENEKIQKEKKRLRERNRYHQNKNVKKSTSTSTICNSDPTCDNVSFSNTNATFDSKSKERIYSQPMNKRKRTLNNSNEHGAEIKKKKKLSFSNNSEINVMWKVAARERKRKQRAKIYADNDKYVQFLNEQRMHNEKRRKKGLIKSISQMNQKDQLVQRKKWRNSKRRERTSKKARTRSKTIKD